MSANIGMLILIGVLTSAGVYLLIERSITRMLLGLLLFGNAINLLILTVGGSDGNPPIVGRDSVHEEIADPLAQGMILTAIVITMGIAGFVLALAYRSYKINTADAVARNFGPRVQPVLRAAKEHGVLVVVGLRIVPAAPGTLTNLALGASGIRFADFIVGTLFGMLPGLIVGAAAVGADSSRKMNCGLARIASKQSQFRAALPIPP